jgi:hypothetical protein
MLPNVLQTSATDHVPVLADEVRELLAVRRARPSSTRPSAPAATRAARRRPARRGQADRDRPRPDARAVLRALPPRRRVRRALPARRLLDRPRAARRERRAADAILLDLGVSSMQIDRPERGFSYAATRRSTCAWTRRPSDGARELVNEADERELATIFRRYGEERYAKQIARAIVRRRASSRSSAPASSSRRSRPRSRAGALRRRPSGEARLPGAADRGQRRARLARGARCRRRSRCCARAAGSRDQLPLARGPDRQAVPARPGARLHVPARLPGLRLRPRAGAARAFAAAADPPSAAELAATRARVGAAARAAVKV